MEIGCHLPQFQKTLDNATVRGVLAVWGLTTNSGGRVRVTGFVENASNPLDLGIELFSDSFLFFPVFVGLVDSPTSEHLSFFGCHWEALCEAVLILELIELGESLDLLFTSLVEQLLEMFNLGTRLLEVVIAKLGGFMEGNCHSFLLEIGVLLLELEDVVGDGSGVHVGRHFELLIFPLLFRDLSAIKINLYINETFTYYSHRNIYTSGLRVLYNDGIIHSNRGEL